jgi:hypothetical protein
LYEVEDHRVLIVAFLHDARDFATVEGSTEGVASGASQATETPKSASAPARAVVDDCLRRDALSR